MKRWSPKITKEEFVKKYTADMSPNLKKKLMKMNVALPCVCEGEDCLGRMFFEIEGIHVYNYLYKPDNIIIGYDVGEPSKICVLFDIRYNPLLPTNETHG